MHLILVIPGLFAQEAHADAPHLARLLTQAGAPTREPHGIAALLAAAFGVGRQVDWPLAPIRLAALDVDPGNAYWLAADPITLVAGRDDVRIAGRALDLSVDDAGSMIAALNAHFMTDHIAFIAPRPSAWFVRCAIAPEIATMPLDAAMSRSLRALFPTGADAGKWNRWQSEIQMLLAEHPVNAARERDGRPPVNALWLAEGGTLPARPSVTIRTFASGGDAAALSAHAHAPPAPVPARLAAALADAGGAATVVVALDIAIDLAAIERDWAAPAWNSLLNGAVESVALFADGNGEGVRWTARRPRLFGRVAARFASPDLPSMLAAARTDT